MKCNIKADGVMELSPETELESYAFNKWQEENVHYDEEAATQVRITALLFMPLEPIK